MKVRPLHAILAALAMMSMPAHGLFTSGQNELEAAETSVLDHLVEVATSVTDWDAHCADLYSTTFPPFPLQEPQADAVYADDGRIIVTVEAAGGYVKVKMDPNCV